jgi:hypothetical protein
VSLIQPNPVKNARLNLKGGAGSAKMHSNLRVKHLSKKSKLKERK